MPRPCIPEPLCLNGLPYPLSKQGLVRGHLTQEVWLFTDKRAELEPTAPCVTEKQATD